MEELAAVERDGYVVIENLLSPHELGALRAALDVELAAQKLGRNPFEGFATQRVYTLVAKAAAFAELVQHPKMLALCDRLLAPNYLLTISQAIEIHPGEVAQALHNDDAFYPLPRPRPPVSVSTIWAIDDFSEENGATEIIPGSHAWDDATLDRRVYRQDFRTRRGAEERREARRPEDEPALLARLKKVVMPAGSVVFFLGTLVHRGGANRSDRPRRAVTNQYCQPWARQQENYTLAVPPEEAARLPERVRQMLGYSIHPPFMGHVHGVHPDRLLPH
jgi:ectoine hydroxylase-related dioxygenase (phytanoyl-CoA dioxygenase family)